MFKSSTYEFDKTLDKATSLTNLEPDWPSILQICDSIRQGDVQPKYALNGIKKKMNATNPNVQLMALQVLESCVKNCGSIFHFEVATKEFMEELHSMLKNSSDLKVKNEILRLVQAWSHAFRKEPSFKAVGDEMKIMKAEGYQFPAFKENDAMFQADQAPGWSDGNCCHRCRVEFSLVNRKHHCRNCGQVFCAKCSAKTSTIPQYGFEKEVRVCDVCFDKINRKIDVKPSANKEEDRSKSVSNSNSNPSPSKGKTEQEIQEEEELQLALAISKSLAESEKPRNYKQPTNWSSESKTHKESKSHKKGSKSGKSGSSKSASKKEKDKEREKWSPDGILNDYVDPELNMYLNREYWEQRANNLYSEYENAPFPSAPQPNANSTVKNDSTFNLKAVDPVKSIKPPQEELDNFTSNLRSTIEIFVNRLNSNKLRGRPITNDSGVESLFLNLTNMHSHLMMYMQQTSEQRSNCERLQDKINQIRDARDALDALREEHKDQLKRAAEEAERLRQQQMAQKLEIMRKKKQEYLQYQRELAMQRIQEQERELMMKTEQLKFAASQAQNQVPAIAQPGQWNMHQNTSMAYSQPTAISAPYYPMDNNYSAMNHQPGVIPGAHYAQPMQHTPTMVTGSHTGPILQTQQPMAPVMPVVGPPPHSTPHPHMMAPPHAPHQMMPQHLPHQMPPQGQYGYMPNAPGPVGVAPQAAPVNPEYPAVPQHTPEQPQQHQPPPPVSEAKEELLISFD